MRELLIALQLARVIAGEAAGCPVDAKLAVAWTANNRVREGIVENWREGWYGDRKAETTDIVIALLWDKMPDTSNGAIYMIGPGDKAKMPWLAGMTRARRWECLGTHLEAYKEHNHGGQH